jgi:ferritin-like metal-binding protein YciE
VAVGGKGSTSSRACSPTRRRQAPRPRAVLRSQVPRAFEYLEIGGYEQLKRVATRAGDEGTAAVADQILAQERHALLAIAGAFDAAVQASLREAEVVGR